MFEIGLAIGKLIKESKIYTVIINARVNIKRFLFFIPIVILISLYFFLLIKLSFYSNSLKKVCPKLETSNLEIDSDHI